MYVNVYKCMYINVCNVWKNDQKIDKFPGENLASFGSRNIRDFIEKTLILAPEPDFVCFCFWDTLPRLGFFLDFSMKIGGFWMDFDEIKWKNMKEMKGN